MTPEERQLLTGLFDRLQQNDRGDRDSEAERLINAAVATHPTAPYLMAQLLLVQDQALSAAQNRIRALQQELASARVSPLSPGSNRSFLPGTPQRGPWGEAPAAATSVSSPPPPAQASPPSSGDFLRGALQTAAGVAGGALLFEGINSLLNLGSAGWGGLHGAAPGGFLNPGGAPTLIEKTVINQFGSAEPPGADASEAGDALTADGDDDQANAAEWTDNTDSDTA